MPLRLGQVTAGQACCPPFIVSTNVTAGVYGASNGPARILREVHDDVVMFIVTAPAQPERRRGRKRPDAISAAGRALRRMPETVAGDSSAVAGRGPAIVA